jgi:hypothetical protein
MSRLLNVHSVGDIRQMGLYIAEKFVPDPSTFEVEIASLNLKSYKSPHSEKIPLELIQALGKILQSENHNSLIPFGIRKNCLISELTLELS